MPIKHCEQTIILKANSYEEYSKLSSNLLQQNYHYLDCIGCFMLYSKGPNFAKIEMAFWGKTNEHIHARNKY